MATLEERTTSPAVECDSPMIGPDSAGIRMSLAEFEAIEDYDRNYHYELIHGVLVVTPFAGDAEADPNEELGRLLRNYGDSAGSCLDYTVHERYLRTSAGMRRCDRAMWCGLGRLPDTRQDTPAIVVEFVSAGRRSWLRDYVEKRDEYLALGVQEYWIINRFLRTMTIFSRLPDGAPREQQISAAQSYSTPLLPGFELSLDRLLKLANRWAP